MIYYDVIGQHDNKNAFTLAVGQFLELGFCGTNFKNAI